MSRRAVSWGVIAFAGWTSIASGQTPAVTLGPPVAAKPGPVVRGQSPDDGMHYSHWVAGTVEPGGDTVPPILPLRVPSATVTVSASVPDYPPPPPAPAAPFPDPPPPPPPQPRPTQTARQHKSFFGDMFNDMGGGGPEGKCLQSDHCFDYFASPVSNPFFFEDPRSLTELRPIFLFQTIPHGNNFYNGGNADFFGTQARLAITDQWSFVMNKLGGVWFNSGHDALVPSESGLAEIWLGPKWTFLRNTESGTVLAAGTTFQIPAGPSRVAQDTGTLSVVPYISGAQNFGCTSYGSFNAMATLGYAIRADNQRSEYLFTSWHLDFDVGNQHRLYPLVELNWFHYTRSGNERPYNFEGRDLANFGSRDVAGTNNLSIATGLRYKFTESIQAGLALEFPLITRHDFSSFRLGLDMIFRY